MKNLLLVAVLFGFTALAAAQELQVAAASDLSPVLPKIAARFERETGNKVHLNFAASDQLLSQIENGSSYDLVVSSSLPHVLRLEAEGLLEPNSLSEFAVGKLVLYVPQGSRISPSRGLRALLAPSVRKIAIADRGHAPYGRAAVEALKSESLYEALQSKLVIAEDIAQAAKLVQSGSADAAILALSLVRTPALASAGRYAALPVGGYKPLVQTAGILKTATQKSTAAEFLRFLRSPASAAILAHYGFALPVGSRAR